MIFVTVLVLVLALALEPKKALLFYELKKYFQLFQSYEVQYDKKFFKKIISKHLFFLSVQCPWNLRFDCEPHCAGTARARIQCGFSCTLVKTKSYGTTSVAAGTVLVIKFKIFCRLNAELEGTVASEELTSSSAAFEVSIVLMTTLLLFSVLTALGSS